MAPRTQTLEEVRNELTTWCGIRTTKAVRAAVYAAVPGRQRTANFRQVLKVAYKAALRAARRHDGV